MTWLVLHMLSMKVAHTNSGPQQAIELQLLMQSSHADRTMNATSCLNQTETTRSLSVLSSSKLASLWAEARQPDQATFRAMQLSAAHNSFYTFSFLSKGIVVTLRLHIAMM